MRNFLEWPRWIWILLWCFLLLLLAAWLIVTPSGLLGKADAIGYAFCHRIPERSFALGERSLPLCARCSGMYLGALVGFLYQLQFGRRGGLPGKQVQVVMALSALWFALDGSNSYLTLFPGMPSLYQPENGLRLLTGSLLGLGVSALLMPTFIQTAWRNWDERPAFGSLRQYGLAAGLVGMVDLAIASNNPLLLYPLALFSVAALVGLLVMAYGLVWILIFKRDNQFDHWRELLPLIWISLLTVMLQVSAVEAIRYALTGTWAGFNL